MRLTCLMVLLATGLPATVPADTHDLTGGVLICHAPPQPYTPGEVDLCDSTFFQPQPCCEGQENMLPADDGIPYTWYIISSFYEPKRFSAIECGIDYQGTAYHAGGAGICAPGPYLTIEYPGPGSWPGDGAAIAVGLVGGVEWSGSCVATSYIWGWHYTYEDPGVIRLVPSAQTGFIGWLSDEVLYTPECVGALGFDMPGEPCCSLVPQLHACCFPDGTCRLLTHFACESAAGILYPNLPCEPSPCPQPQTCCFEWECRLLQPDDCAAQGGVVFPQPGCTPDPCLPAEPHACCFGPECLVLPPADCLAQGGVIYPETDCEDDPCPDFMACCAGADCVDVLVPDECNDLGGVLYPTFVCESPGFECPELPAWACCFAYDENCYTVSEEDCLAAGGTSFAGVLCDAFDCPLWRVCCVGEVCHLTVEEGCEALGGTWHPEWLRCDREDPCGGHPVSPAPASWGAIKAIYR
jgi:hypothetical protein